jgi:hypothetical protein
MEKSACKGGNGVLQDDIFKTVLETLKSRPKRLEDTEVWLFNAVNTAKALIDSTDKNAHENDVFTGCRTVSEIQLSFDMIQGRYGRKFSSASNRTYNYLCSLVAFCEDKELSDDELMLISQYNRIEKYLLYELG